MDAANRSSLARFGRLDSAALSAGRGGAEPGPAPCHLSGALAEQDLLGFLVVGQVHAHLLADLDGLLHR